ncbi:MAG: TonB-dependent receptor [Hyphomicrobium sp.]|nr:TonB-dependent receptor [Hyphomicrobium sp.]
MSLSNCSLRVRASRAGLSVITAGLLVSVSGPAATAQEVTALEGIIVYSANRTPTEAAKVGSSVEVVTTKEITSRSQTYVKDYLETLPGVSFSQFGPPGTQAGISLRGAGGKYTKVLVDGIDISDPSGAATEPAFEHLLVGDVARIEVLKGSQSTLYGGEAVGGVISIDTRRTLHPGFSHFGGAEYGAYNSFRGDYTLGYAATDGSNISFTAQGVDSSGFSAAADGSEDDGYQNLTFSSRGDYMVSPSARLFFAARTVDAKLNFDGCCDPVSSRAFDNFDSVDVKQHAGRGGVEFSLFDKAFTNMFAIQGVLNTRDYHGSITDFYDGDRIKAEYQGTLRFNERLSVLFGTDWEQLGAESSSILTRETSDMFGTFAQLMVEPIDGLVLTAGGRLDDHSNFGDFKTHRLTAAYSIDATGTKFRGSWGTGFRTPSLDEMYASYPQFGLPNYGNPDLEPEESESWDAGIEQRLFADKLIVGATYFELDTSNLIFFNDQCFTLPVGCLTNLPGVTHREGVELVARAFLSDTFVVSTSYTNTETETQAGARLSYVPRHMATLGVDWQPMDKVAFNVTAKLSDDAVRGGQIAVDDYLLVSARAAYEFMPGVEAYVRGENLLDQDYETYYGYGTAGLSVYGGVRMALPKN